MLLEKNFMSGVLDTCAANASDANGPVGDVCPPGFYCEAGSVAPRGCPSGTYSPSTGNTNVSACLPCEPGFMCPNASTADPTEPCPAGFFCPAGNFVVCFTGAINLCDEASR